MCKIKNLYILIAREVLTDASDGMSTIVKVIERFGVDIKKGAVPEGQPMLSPINYSVATSWFIDEKLKRDTFLTFRLNIMSPDGKVQQGPTQEHLVPAGIDRLNVNFVVQGLPITESGKYELRTEVLDKEGVKLAKANYPFEVDITISE